MKNLKYPKNAQGQSIIGNEYGIDITKPWSKEMYAHNDKVADQMKTAIEAALEKAYKKGDAKNVEIIARAINSYGYGSMMDIDDIYEDAKNGLDNLQNHWLNDNAWPECIEAGLVKQVPQQLIGYNKK
jgi:hypothetical protein